MAGTWSGCGRRSQERIGAGSDTPQTVVGCVRCALPDNLGAGAYDDCLQFPPGQRTIRITITLVMRVSAWSAGHNPIAQAQALGPRPGELVLTPRPWRTCAADHLRRDIRRTRETRPGDAETGSVDRSSGEETQVRTGWATNAEDRPWIRGVRIRLLLRTPRPTCEEHPRGRGQRRATPSRWSRHTGLREPRPSMTPLSGLS